VFQNLVDLLNFIKQVDGQIKQEDLKKKEEKKQEAPKSVPFGKGTRIIKKKTTRYFYSSSESKTPLHSKIRKSHHKPARLRKSITPGTVLILIAGRFRGHRVLFLKRLESGLLLVTGPFKVNGVPARRVDQAYVIATSTKLDISGVKVPEVFNDDYFKRPTEKKEQKSEDKFFSGKEEKKTLPETRVKDQKELDSQLLPLLKKTPSLNKYLGARFSLKKKQYPHAMIF